jgi:alcohol dehydrogenase class IV
VVARENSYRVSGAERFFKENIEAQIEVHRFSDFSENPKIGDVERGVSLFGNIKPDMIVAVGGGSAIDMAKLINYFSARGVTAKQYLNHEAGYDRKCVPFVAIPTTVGSGSEATRFAVMYVDGKKHSIEHASLRPDVVILDPVLTSSLPPSVIASSGMDALSQAVESYWSINSNVESKGYAEEAIKILLHNMADAVSKHSPLTMENMMHAAFLAGRAINITKTTAPHAISYTLTSHFGVSHGQAVGLLLPSFFEYNYNVSETDCMDKRGVEYVKETMLSLCNILGCDGPLVMKNKVRDLMLKIGLQARLSMVGVSEGHHIDLIVENVNTERLTNNPRVVTKEKIHDILIEMM